MRTTGTFLQLGGFLALAGAWAVPSHSRSLLVAYAGFAAVLAGSLLKTRAELDRVTAQP